MGVLWHHVAGVVLYSGCIVASRGRGIVVQWVYCGITWQGYCCTVGVLWHHVAGVVLYSGCIVASRGRGIVVQWVYCGITWQG